MARAAEDILDRAFLDPLTNEDTRGDTKVAVAWAIGIRAEALQDIEALSGTGTGGAP